MRKFAFILPIAAVAVATGVLLAGLGHSLASTDLPEPVAAQVADNSGNSAANELATANGWIETTNVKSKPIKIVEPPKPPKSK